MVLKSEKFDVSFTLTDSFRSAFILWISGAKKRVGFKTQNRSLFLTDPVPVPIQIMHRSNKYLTLTRYKFKDQLSPQFFLSNYEENWAKDKMKIFGLSSPTALLPFSVGKGRSISIKNIKKWMQKVSKKEPKRDSFFRGVRSPKSQKSEPWAQNVPQASRRGSQAPKIFKNQQQKSPRASKITQNHENLVTQNQENPRKKTSRIQEIKKGTVAGLRAAPWIIIKYMME